MEELLPSYPWDLEHEPDYSLDSGSASTSTDFCVPAEYPQSTASPGWSSCGCGDPASGHPPPPLWLPVCCPWSPIQRGLLGPLFPVHSLQREWCACPWPRPQRPCVLTRGYTMLLNFAGFLMLDCLNLYKVRQGVAQLPSPPLQNPGWRDMDGYHLLIPDVQSTTPSEPPRWATWIPSRLSCPLTLAPMSPCLRQVGDPDTWGQGLCRVRADTGRHSGHRR